MSAPASLTQLAARCEVEEPSRDLDAEIAAACRIVPDFDPSIYIVPLTYRALGARVEIGSVNETIGGPDQWWTEASRSPAAFTTSLDAAKTLAPDGSWHVDVHDWTWSDAPCWCASFQRVQGGSAHVVAKAKTEAMARVAAALRARASEQEGQ